MAKPIVHARSSVKKWGGTELDYIEIHNFLDSSKSVVSDARHRCLTHNSWFIGCNGPMERIFGVVITNSDGREVAVRDICEQHILEDYQQRFIPTPQDFLVNLQMQPWMLNGIAGKPESCRNVELSSSPRRPAPKSPPAQTKTPENDSHIEQADHNDKRYEIDLI